MNEPTMADVIVPKSDQYNADTFISGPQTFTVRDVQIRGGQEQPVSIYMEGSDLAFRPCKSMSRVLVQAWGPDAKNYVGRSLTLYRDPSVKWGGMEVGGIRISHMSHVEGKLVMQLTATKGQRKPHIVMPLIAEVKQMPDPAQKWADGFVAKVAEASNAADLTAFVSGRQAKLTELHEKRPDLHGVCMSAAVKREGELAAANATDDAPGEEAALFDGPEAE